MKLFFNQEYNIDDYSNVKGIKSKILFNEFISSLSNLLMKYEEGLNETHNLYLDTNGSDLLYFFVRGDNTLEKERLHKLLPTLIGGLYNEINPYMGVFKDPSKLEHVNDYFIVIYH